jgi:hypothetical protein
MRRIIVLLSVILVGVAAPARAWCEASCLAPKPDSPSHCPSHQPADAATSISGTLVDACPVLDSARPTEPARLEASAVVVAVHPPAPKTSAIHSPALVRPHHAATVFERCTPLRI